MICGHCKESGPEVTVAHVRGCAGSPAPTPQPKLESWEPEDGTFRYNGRPVRVRLAIHGSKKLYASELEETPDKKDPDVIRFRWQFASGLIGEMQRAKPGSVVKMSMEEAIEFGKLYGQCIRCGRVLTKDTSIAQAMGDKCAGKFE